MAVTRRFAAFAVACTALAFTGAHAAGARRVAVVSQLGDAISIEDYRSRTGTNIDSSHRSVAMAKPVYDFAALLAAQDAIKRTDASMQVAPLAPAKPGSDSDPARFVAGDKLDPANALVAALRTQGYDLLLVMTKFRAPAQMTLRENVKVGTGQIAGLGFYIDRSLQIEKVGRADSTRGFIAPYAYMKLALFDLSTLAQVAEKEVLAESIQGTMGTQTSLEPWDALTPEQKTTMLRDLVTDGVAGAVPALFGPH